MIKMWKDLIRKEAAEMHLMVIDGPTVEMQTRLFDDSTVDVRIWALAGPVQ